MFTLAALMAVLRQAVTLNIQDETTLIIYLVESDTLSAVRESQTMDYDWNQNSGTWQRLGCLGADNLAEIDGLDDDTLAQYVQWKCYLPGVDKVAA